MSKMAPRNAGNPRLQWLCGLALALLLAGCVNTRNGVMVQNSAAKEAPVVTDSDETNGRKRAKLRVELAVGYYEQGQTTVALDEVKQALAADPTFADAYNLRGLIYMRLDDPGLAEDSFRRAVALAPRDPNVLHNYGWLLCQQNRYADAQQQFNAALAIPTYEDRAKTLMTAGVCQIKAGQRLEAERTLQQAYELDASNPIVGFNLAMLMSQRNDWQRAQFYIRRVNNSPSASAETLWLGVKVERQMGNKDAQEQLGSQLQRRFPDSREAVAYGRGNFND
jgi:type IV pilus assembly protein PilF